jgi:hypothetical protein
MKIVHVLSTSISDLNKRVVKFLGLGKRDIQTSDEANPYGLDSNPTKGSIAIYSETSEKGQTVILGYLNKNQLAGVGEFRMFSTDDDGTLKFYVWLKSTGIIEIGGDSNYAVKFNELKTEFNKLKSDHNDLIQKWNSFCTSYVPGSPSVTGLPATLGTSVLVANASDIDNAKNAKIKTI